MTDAHAAGVRRVAAPAARGAADGWTRTVLVSVRDDEGFPPVAPCPLRGEQRRPDQLVRDLQRAEAAGVDFSVIGDHDNPWLEAQGHAGDASSILGAAAVGTQRVPLTTSVTPPGPPVPPRDRRPDGRHGADPRSGPVAPGAGRRRETQPARRRRAVARRRCSPRAVGCSPHGGITSARRFASPNRLLTRLGPADTVLLPSRHGRPPYPWGSRATCSSPVP